MYMAGYFSFITIMGTVVFCLCHQFSEAAHPTHA